MNGDPRAYLPDQGGPGPGPSGRQLGRRVLGGMFWAFSVKAISVLSALAINALLARLLPPDQLGAYFLASSITMFAAIVARFGLRQTIVRLVAEAVARGLPGRAGKTLRIVYLVTTAGAITVGFAMCWGVIPWLAEDVFKLPILAAASGLLSAWIAVLAFQTPVAETFRALHNIKLATLLDGVLANILLAFALAVALTAGFDVSFWNAVLISFLAALASLAIGTLLLVPEAQRFHGEGDIRVAEVLRMSAPIFVVNLAMQAITNCSLWIVGAYLPAGEVAVYGAAWRLVNFIALPLLIVNMTVQPFIAELYALEHKQKLQDLLRGAATVSGIPALLVLAIFIAFSADLLQLIYGEHYRSGAMVLAVLCAGQIISVWSGSCGLVLAFTGHERQFMNLTLLAGAISVVLAVVGVQFWGMIGVAYAVTAGRILQNVSAWLYVKRLTGLWTHAAINPRFIMMAVTRILSSKSGGRSHQESAEDN